MKKMQRFREALLASWPDLAANPENVAIFAERGRVVSGGSPGRGFAYHYQLTAIIQDFAGDVDRVADAALRWIRAEMPGLLANPELAEKALRFEVEMITSELVDLKLELDVQEAIAVDAAGTITHPPEPPDDLMENVLWQTAT
ncbi:phage tail protein [Luteibacter mycovicinus]|uniref:phage tail protein n=1 Tax=Luteibacter mycovicinus TaxID=1500890 RepID=UPI00055CE15B|nr:phage tail protein [Luteibacter sp. 9143a]